jgi:hypothetical protein
MILLNYRAPTNFCPPRSTHVNPKLHLPLAVLFVCLAWTHAALADEATNATIGQLGLACKNRVVEQFDVPNSDIGVRLGATLQQDIDAGAMTAQDLKARGASFDWEVAGKGAKGYCNVDGQGKITEFEQW